LIICKVSFEETKGGQSDVGQASRRGQLLWDETNSDKGKFGRVLSSDAEAGCVMLCKFR